MDPHQLKLMAAAANLGIKTTDLSHSWKEDVICYEKDGQKKLIFKGRIYPGLSSEQERIADNKIASKSFLEPLKIPFPKSICVKDVQAEKSEIEAFLKDQGCCVFKPLRGTEGEAILMNVNKVNELEAHLHLHQDKYPLFMLEEQLEGYDLRIQAIEGKLIAACKREPAYVKGDGQRSIKALIEARNRVIQAQNPDNHLEVDRATCQLLEAQELTLDSLPKVGQKVQLKYVSNMSQGGVAVDLTDELHPQYKGWIERIAAHLKLSIFALDVMTKDHQKPPKNQTKALEINVRPQWLHHTFSERRRHKIPHLILESLFCINSLQGG